MTVNPPTRKQVTTKLKAMNSQSERSCLTRSEVTIENSVDIVPAPGVHLALLTARVRRTIRSFFAPIRMTATP